MDKVLINSSTKQVKQFLGETVDPSFVVPAGYEIITVDKLPEWWTHE